MNGQAAEIGEMIGRAMSRRDVVPSPAPVVHLNVPDVKISAKVDEAAIVRGIDEAIDRVAIAHRESIEAVASKTSAALVGALAGIPGADFSDVSSAILRLAEEAKTHDYSRQFQLLLVEMAGVKAAIENEGKMMAEHALRIEAALLAEKIMKYDDQGRVVSVKPKGKS